MDYTFVTTPSTFTADLAGQNIPSLVKTAIGAAWAATPQSDPSYQVSAATGDLWTVVRVAAVRGGL